MKVSPFNDLAPVPVLVLDGKTTIYLKLGSLELRCDG